MCHVAATHIGKSSALPGDSPSFDLYRDRKHKVATMMRRSLLSRFRVCKPDSLGFTGEIAIPQPSTTIGKSPDVLNPLRIYPVQIGVALMDVTFTAKIVGVPAPRMPGAAYRERLGRFRRAHDPCGYHVRSTRSPRIAAPAPGGGVASMAEYAFDFFHVGLAVESQLFRPRIPCVIRRPHKLQIVEALQLVGRCRP